MTKTTVLHLGHILKSIQLIESFVTGCSIDNLHKDYIRYHAILWNLQTLSESLSKLPPSIQNNYPQIPWKDIAGFRNILVHDYLEGFDTDIILSIIFDELPKIKVMAYEVKKAVDNE